jgi:hypothetical protein
MKATSVLFFMLTAAHAQMLNLPNGGKIETLADGSVWVVIRPSEVRVAFMVDKSMPTTGNFRTYVVENLPESDIVNAPQSLKIDLYGHCQSKTFEIYGTLPYEGKMGGGLPVVELKTEPDSLLRHVTANSPMAAVFQIICK